MAIPEHNKCVISHKRSRDQWQNGNWRKVRAIRRKNGDMRFKMRVRQMLKAELSLERSKIEEQYGMKYTEFFKTVRGPFYRKWNKYDD